MLPEMRAAADKLIFDVATTKYVASIIGKRALDRRIDSLGWTVRQLLGHLAFSLETYADQVAALAAGDDSAARIDWDAANAEAAEATAKRRLPELLDTMSGARDRCIAEFSRLDEQALERQVRDGMTIRQIVNGCMGHFEEHALDLTDAEPRLRQDPMVLNWILYADFERHPRLKARQEQLVAEVREWLKSEDDGEE